MKLVIAGTYERFRFWCEEHGVSPLQNRREARYISLERDLRGLRGEGLEVVFVDGWSRNKHWMEANDIRDQVRRLEDMGALVTYQA